MGSDGLKMWVATRKARGKRCENCRMNIERNVPLARLNTFGIVAKALQLVRITHANDVTQLLKAPETAALPKFVLGGGSNLVITGDVKPLVLKVEVLGMRLVEEQEKAFIVEAGAGENWHEFVRWTVEKGYLGLENLALIPGTVGATPVQNVGAYGIETKDRFDSLDCVDLNSGLLRTMGKEECQFGYRDSVFKKPVSSGGLSGQMLITHVRFRLRKPWVREIGYADITKKVLETGTSAPTALQIFEWVSAIRTAKLPDPQVMGNAGSFFKNPTVTAEQCRDIIQREPGIVHYPLGDGRFKLAAGWLIDACGWKGKHVGQAAVHSKHALVLINLGACTGGEVVTLAKAIQTSVYERFGIRLEPEPVVL